MIDQALKDKCAAELHTVADQIPKLKMQTVQIKPFTLAAIVKNRDLKQAVAEFEGGQKLDDSRPAIYVISVDPKYFPLFVQKFEPAKVKWHGKLALTSLSEFSGGNQALYVGKVHENITKRLRDHLGFQTNTTRALHLLRWESPDLMAVEMTMTIHYFEPGTDARAVTLLEEALYEKLRPVFGAGLGSRVR